MLPEIKATMPPGLLALPSQDKFTKQTRRRGSGASDITFIGLPEGKGRRSSMWSQLKHQLPANLRRDPNAAADLMYQQMHRMSMKGEAKIKRRQDDEVSVSEKTQSTGSQITISTLSERPVYTMKTYAIFSAEEDAIVDPRFLMEDDMWQDAHVKHAREQAQSLIDRSRDVDNVRRIMAIIKYKEKMIYMMKPVNVANTPESALKVQWRISRYLLAPSFFLVFSMLNRYGPVVALIKRTPNSALCVYDNVDLAARVLHMHALNQSNKVLILSWWHLKAGSVTNEASMDTRGTSGWLKSLCEGIAKMDELTRGGLQEAIRPFTQHAMGRINSIESQRHMSMIKFEIKRALRKYTALRKEHEDFTIPVGTMPLAKDSKMTADSGSSIGPAYKPQIGQVYKLKSKFIGSLPE